MRELLAELTTTLEQQLECVYCSLVETRGSTPQKAGAAMLVFPDGTQRGTLGGGCVEAEVKQRALRTLAQGGRAEILTFTLDDNYGWDDGLICGGRMSILADPLTRSRPEGLSAVTRYYRHLRQVIEGGQGCTEAVIVGETTPPLAPGSRYLFDARGLMVASLAESPPPATLVESLQPLAQRPTPGVRHGVAYLPTLPRITLLIVGGGHVGQAVAQLAAGVDFDIWVLDDREIYASPQRFPMAQRRLVGDIGATLKELSPTLGPSIYALIVTRGHSHDEEALYHLARARTGYLGMIGSKRKIKLIYEDLVARGLAEETLARVHAPLGFDIGSQTVLEIAISIVAELIACRNLGSTSLRPRVSLRPGTTH